LLGEDNTVGQDLITELTKLRQQIDVNLSDEHDIIIGVDGLESDDLLGEDFEQRIESALEKAVMGSMGSLLVALGKQMINDDDQGFENKIDTFSQTLEREMESRANIIEDKVEKLCSDFVKLEMIETQLQESIAELQPINVFNVSH
jgi:septation ring formation regulator EzrA